MDSRLFDSDPNIITFGKKRVSIGRENKKSAYHSLHLPPVAHFGEKEKKKRKNK